MNTLRKIGSGFASGVRAVGKWIANSLKWSWGFVELSGALAIELPVSCWSAVKAGWNGGRKVRSVFAAICFIPSCLFVVAAVLSLAAVTLVACLVAVPALIVAIALLLGPTLGLLLIAVIFVVIAAILLGEKVTDETITAGEKTGEQFANKVERVFQW